MNEVIGVMLYGTAVFVVTHWPLIQDGSSFRICSKCGARVEGMYKCKCEVKP